MYIVREKTNQEVIYVSPTDIDHNLKPQEVYTGFDAATMEIGWSDTGEIPEHFDFDKNGKVVQLSLTQQVEKGIIRIEPTQKIEDDMIVDKNLTELVEEGLFQLEPHEKIVDNQIVEMSMEEQVKEGLITLELYEKIVDNQVVEKSLEEQVKEGLIELEPNQKIEDNEIIEMTVREMFDQGLVKLDKVKEERLAYYSELAMTRRQEIIPDYKQQNAALGVYDQKKVEEIKTTVMKFKDEFKRIKGLIQKARTIKAIDALKANFPTG